MANEELLSALGRSRQTVIEHSGGKDETKNTRANYTEIIRIRLFSLVWFAVTLALVGRGVFALSGFLVAWAVAEVLAELDLDPPDWLNLAVIVVFSGVSIWALSNNLLDDYWFPLFWELRDEGAAQMWVGVQPAGEAWGAWIPAWFLILRVMLVVGPPLVIDDATQAYLFNKLREIIIPTGSSPPIDAVDPGSLPMPRGWEIHGKQDGKPAAAPSPAPQQPVTDVVVSYIDRDPHLRTVGESTRVSNGNGGSGRQRSIRARPEQFEAARAVLLSNDGYLDEGKLGQGNIWTTEDFRAWRQQLMDAGFVERASAHPNAAHILSEKGKRFFNARGWQ